MRGHKAIDWKSQGKRKDTTRWYHGNKGKGLSKGGAKGFTKSKGKGMNNCEHAKRRWPATPSFHDLLSLEQETESVHSAKEKKQHSHVNHSTETRATSEPHQQWKVPVKWVRAHTKNNKKKLQVRSRIEALRTDDKEFSITDEHNDPGLPEAVAKKGGMKSQTCKYRSAMTKLNARDEGIETDLCPLERGKMLGSTEGEEWRLMPRPLVIDSGAAETVLPTDWFTGHELKETEESRGGQFYVCAGGREIPNYGERTITLSKLDWSSVRNMTFQVTDVTKALGSVS